MDKIVLELPSKDDEEKIMEYKNEFLVNEDSMDGTSGLRDAKTFDDWLAMLKSYSNEYTVPNGYVPSTTYLAIREIDNKLIGMIDIRHRLNENLIKVGGHIGYSVRKTERRKGYAKQMLHLALLKCEELNISRVLVTCDYDNVASAKTILANGGVFENEILDEKDRVMVQRYWIQNSEYRRIKMNTNIEKTIGFLKEQFEKSNYMSNNPISKNYRIEHTIRVANIGKEIAIKENFDTEAMIIGCILHDVSYMMDFNDEDDWLNHGRNAAKIARPFLESLNYDKEKINEICYGIAIHVDDESDFEGEKTPFALSIGDSDNIDRFDAYRIYENLQKKNFDILPLEEKLAYVTGVIEKSNKYLDMKLGTNTAKKMWIERIYFQIQFFEKLKKQIELSTNII